MRRIMFIGLLLVAGAAGCKEDEEDVIPCYTAADIAGEWHLIRTYEKLEDTTYTYGLDESVYTFDDEETVIFSSWGIQAGGTFLMLPGPTIRFNFDEAISEFHIDTLENQLLVLDNPERRLRLISGAL